MITVISGDDKTAISNFVNGKIKSFKSDQVYRFDDSDISFTELQDFINSQGLFSWERLIVYRIRKNVKGSIDSKLIVNLKNDTSCDLIIDVSELSQKTHFMKMIGKNLKLIEFSKKPDYSNFNIADALIIDKQLERALKIFNGMENVDDAIYSLIATIAYDIKGVLSVRYKNKTSKQFKPFVRKKFERSKLDEEQLKKIYVELVKLDAECRNYDRKLSVRDLFLDFVFRNFLN